MKGIEDDFIPKFSFFQFKKCRVYDNSNQNYKFMLCFTDISQKILYDTSKAEGELLSLINSTISHEMRNPLNSIVNQCTIMESLLHSFKLLIEQIKKLGAGFSNLEEQFVEIHKEVSSSINIQQSSSNLLLMNVEDILGYAQIKANKFNKIIKKFNIKKAIEEIN
jgi:signal transduction histidine kinase